MNNLKTPKDYKILSLMNMLIKKTCEHIDQSLIDGVKIFLEKGESEKIIKKEKVKNISKKGESEFPTGWLLDRCRWNDAAEKNSARLNFFLKFSKVDFF